MEKFYHHWFASDRHMLGLIDELGWQRPGALPPPVHGDVLQGRFYPFDSILKAILFPGLGWGINKARFGLVGLYLRLTNNWQALEQYTVDAWMRSWAGDRVYELMWEPLMIGKFGERYAKQVNMAWMWARSKPAPPAWAPSRAASRPLPTALPTGCARWASQMRALHPGAAHRLPARRRARCWRSGQRAAELSTSAW